MIRFHATLLLVAVAITLPSRGAWGQAAYRIEPAGTSFRAENPGQHMTARFHDGRTDYEYRGRHFWMELRGEVPPTAAHPAGPRIEFERGPVTEWFLNQASGIEQGFTVSERRGRGPLLLHLATGGDLTPAIEGGAIVLRRGGETMLRYDGLRSWDREGRDLPSRARVSGRDIVLEVDDTAAKYPVTVDPAVQEVKLIAPDAAASDQAGFSVAISGDTAIVGAHAKANHVGRAYIWTRSGSTWTLQAELNPPNLSQFASFGQAVAISGDTAVATAPADSVGGSVYVFTRTGSTWTQQARLTANDDVAHNGLGHSVSIDGDTIAVGADTTSFIGAVYVFTRAGNAWSQQARLTASDGAQFDSLGYSVSLSGDTVVGGAPFASGGGAAYVFSRSGASWSQQAKVTASDGASQDEFGIAVSISGDTVLAGAQLHKSGAGAAYIFTRSGTAWSQQAILNPPVQAHLAFGNSVALNGDLAAIGASSENSETGAIYLIKRSGTQWGPLLRVVPDNPTTGMDFGSSVSLSGDTVLVGADRDNGLTGSATAFRLSNVAIYSNPAGRSFTLSGAACPQAGTFQTPYRGLWSACTVQWTSPEVVGGTRYAFQSWGDGGNSNPRAIPLTGDPTGQGATFSGDFTTEYLLTTQSVPVSGGNVSGGGWYLAGQKTAVAETPNSGFVFTGFSGGAHGFANPTLLTMTAPLTVTGNFTATPPAALTAIISAKNGAAQARQWIITITNTGPGVAYDAHAFGLMMTQTFGTACTSMPVRLAPAAFPAGLGNLAVGGSAQTAALLDFSGCPVNARFTVSIGAASNGGSSVGMIQLANQVQ